MSANRCCRRQSATVRAERSNISPDGAEGRIGVPQPVAEIEHAAAVVTRQRLALFVKVRNVDHPV